jgi:hypothetical protein
MKSLQSDTPEHAITQSAANVLEVSILAEKNGIELEQT